MNGEEIVQAAVTSREAGIGQLYPVAATNMWSVERVLYGVALMVGMWLRLWDLGGKPLSPWEASNSWPAWLVANGLQVADSPVPISALYYSLQWLIFGLGANSDGGARFVSAIAGTTLVVLPWWWRGFAGRRVALGMAFLIAFDPWLSSFSRLADGASLALSFGMLTLVAVSQVAKGPESILWKRMAAIGLGLLLVSGPMGWNFVPVVAWMGWLHRSEMANAGLLQRKWLLWVVGSAFVGATAWFTRLEALAGVASGMSMWLSQLDGRSAGPLLPALTGGYDLLWPWVRLFVDAGLLLVLGFGGLVALALGVRGTLGAKPQLRVLLHFCLGWLLWGVFLYLMPGRSPLALPMVGLPLLILSAFGFDALFFYFPRNLDWREAGAVVLTLVVLFVSGIFWVAALLANRAYDPVLAQAALVIFGLAIAILVAFGIWANRRDASWVAASLLSLLLLIFYLRGSWKLNYGGVIDEPSGWQALVVHPEVRLLVDDIETLSSLRVGDAYQLPVQVQVAPIITQSGQVIPARPDPVLGWELRNMRNLTWVTSPSVSAGASPLPLVLTQALDANEVIPLDLPPLYAGSRYRVAAWWLPFTLSEEDSTTVTDDGSGWVGRLAAGSRPWWRWFVYREAASEPQTRDVILWAPLDFEPK